MSLPLVTSPCPIMWVRLSRGSELYVQRQRFHAIGGGSVELDSVFIEESHGPLVRACNAWVESHLNTDAPIPQTLRRERNYSGHAKLLLKDVGGIGAVGVVSAQSLATYVALRFHARINGELDREGVKMNLGNLGIVKATEARDPRARPHPRRRTP